MKRELLNYLVCPKCSSGFTLTIEEKMNDEVKEGFLNCKCGLNYKIRNFIPRFVEEDRYAESFSFEWKRHRDTQMDSANENLISEETFQKRIDFPLVNFKGKLVLDAGCGCGRFLEVAAKYGAIVIGFDLSFAVDTAFNNLSSMHNAHLIQADIFQLPFFPATFDFIYSFGVLHHTPDCENAFKRLPKLLKNNGKISIFVYSSYNKGIVYSSNFWRLITTRLPKQLLHSLSYISVPLYYVYKIPVLGNIGKMLFVISMNPNWKWRVLDTFDWYSPKYQSKHTHAQVCRWFEQEGLGQIKIFEDEVTMLGVKN